METDLERNARMDNSNGSVVLHLCLCIEGEYSNPGG